MSKLPSLARLQRSGKLVFQSVWDHGTPTGGAHGQEVYRLQGEYYTYDGFMEEVDGPFGTLEDALSEPFLAVDGATESVWCSELTTEELIDLLFLSDSAAEETIEISVNGTWMTLQDPSADKAMTIKELVDWLRSLAQSYKPRDMGPPTSFAESIARGSKGRFSGLLNQAADKIEQLSARDALAYLEAMPGTGMLSENERLKQIRAEVKRRGLRD